ncbi:hypothetical protein CPB86DRAFT_826005 [Serendipita vermifera]|nr:hypothetical protein CPB86DRAFT_826005 [Serendipita vermifera]
MSAANDILIENYKILPMCIESSPGKPGQRAVSGHNRAEIAKHIIPKVTYSFKVKRFWETLGLDGSLRKGFKKYPRPVRGEGESYVKYLNRLSLIVHKKRFKEQRPIIFVNSEYNYFAHPTGTLCKPDFVALRHLVGKNMDPKRIKDLYSNHPHWSFLETVGEIRSTGETETEAQNHGVSYTNFLLQARPDLTHVLGIYVHEKGFRLAVSNACGVANLVELSWNHQSAVQLLYGWIYRLYSPYKDPKIAREIESEDNITFRIKVKGKKYMGCKLIKVGTAFGRRSTIFDVPGDEPLVIKYQYIAKNRRFAELSIISNIHEKGPFPGIVRINESASTQLQEQIPSTEEFPVTSEFGEEEASSGAEPEQDSDSGEAEGNPIIVKLFARVGGETGPPVTLERQKTCLVMEDKGISIMDAKTPRDVLIALYDVLEVTRFLWRKRQTLHRDISEGNVLIQEDKTLTIPEDLRTELEEMCFAKALLGKEGPNPEADRLDTPLLLIDFDVAQNHKPTPGKTPTERTGTPYFMARAVRTPEIPGGYHIFPPMPQLSDGAARYKECVGDRLEQFKPNSLRMEGLDKSEPLKIFKHKLRYDAESVFWLLLWWSMQAKPLEDKAVGDCIKQLYWVPFTAEQDGRSFFIDSIKRGTCHPQYGPLEELLGSMAAQLKGDLEMIEESDIRAHEEYLHEAFQRLILEFLFKHLKAKSEFLTLEKDVKRRPVENQEPMKPPRPTFTLATTRRHTPQVTGSRANTTSKRTRKDGDDDDYEETSRSTKRSKRGGDDYA